MPPDRKDQGLSPHPPPTGKPRVGLVLGSGGARGVVHISVIETLIEMGVPIDLMAGSSIGAVVAGIYAVGALGAVKKDIVAIKREDLLKLFDPVFSRSGLFGGRKAVAFLGRYIPRHMRIEDLPIPLRIVTTDYDTGYPIVFRKGNLLEAIRASMSIPGVFTPSRVGNSLLIDGGVADPLPIDVVKAMGADLTIAVSLHPAIGKLGLISLRGSRPGNASAASSKIPPMEKLIHRLLKNGWGSGAGWLKSADEWLDTRRAGLRNKRKLPNLFEIVARTVDIMGYMNTLMMLAANPPTVLINFDFPEIPTLDFTMSGFLLEEGRKAAEARRGEILEKIKSAIA